MIKFIVVHAETIIAFENEINGLIEEGWKLIGEIKILLKDNKFNYFQTLIMSSAVN
jgi:hypothetical protein